MRGPAKIAGILAGWMLIILGMIAPITIDAQPREASDPFRFAMQLYRDGMYLPAAEEFLRISQMSSDTERASEARLWAARSYYGARDWQKTIETVEPLTVNPVGKSRACDAFALAGKTYEGMGETARALDAYATLVGRYPDCPQLGEAAVRSGLITLEMGQPRRSLAFFSKIEDGTPDSLRVIALLGQAQALAGLGEETRATEILHELDQSSLGSEDCRVRLSAGHVHAQLGRMEDAATAFGKAAASCTDSLLAYEAWMSMAAVRVQEENWRDAGRAYENAAALRLDAAAAMPLLQAGEAFGRAERWDDAIRVLLSAQELVGRLPNPSMMVLADAYRGSERFSRAVQIMQIVEATSVGTELASTARWRIAETYLDAGWYRLAANAFEHFWLLNPGHPRSPEALYIVGQTLADRLDRKAGGAEILLRVAADYPYSAEAPEALMMAGDCWLELDLADEARAAYGRIAEDYPTSPAAGSARASLDYIDTYVLQDWERARERLEQEVTGLAPRALLVADVSFEDLKDYPSAASHYESVREGSAEVDPGGRVLFRLGVSLWRIAMDPRGERPDEDRERLLERVGVNLARVVAEYPESPWAQEARWVLDRMQADTWEGEEEGRVLLEFQNLERFAETYGATTERVRWGLARSHEQLGDMGQTDHYATAAGIYSVVAENHPDVREAALLGMARCLFQSGSFAEAASRYEQLAVTYKGRPLQPEMIYRQAESLSRAEEPQPAALLLGRLMNDFEGSPWSARAAVELGHHYSRSGQHREAAGAFEVALGRSTQPGLRQQARLGLAETLARLGRVDEAVAHLDHLIVETRGLPLADRATFAKGGIQEEGGDLQAAEATYRSLLASAPSQDLEAEVWARLGDVLMARGEAPNAAGAYRSARAAGLAESMEPRVLRNHAIALYRSDRGVAGDSVLVTLRTRDPADTTLARVALERGRYLVRSGNDEEGLRMFAMVMENFPAEDLGFRARYEIALRHLSMRELEEARDLLVSIVEGNPGPDLLADVRFRLGSTHYLMNRFGEAAESFERVLETGKERLVREAYFNLGLSREKQNRWDEAADAYRELLRRFPEYEGRDRVAFKIAYALQESGEYDEAIVAYEGVLSGATPEVGAEAQFWMGECYFRSRQLDRAILAFLKVGYLFPDQTMWAATADLRAAELHTRTGRPDQARAVYQRVIEKYGAESQWGVIAREEMSALGPASEAQR